MTAKTNWTHGAIDEVITILTQPRSLTGWDGVGYSIIPEDRTQRSHSFLSLVRMPDGAEYMIDILRTHSKDMPFIRTTPRISVVTTTSETKYGGWNAALLWWRSLCYWGG